MSGYHENEHIVLHIGLHKTGTKFLQHRVFPSLAEQGLINFNPPRLTQLCCDLARAEDTEVSSVKSAIQDEIGHIPHGMPTVISREILAGDLFSGYVSSGALIARLATAFPSAQVLCVFRFQLDWLESVYRESIHEHHYQTFERFIERTPSQNRGYVHLDPKSVNWCTYGSLVRESFGERARFLFFEDLADEPQRFVSDLVSTLGVEWQQDDFYLPGRRRPNRGYSALAIKLSLLRASVASRFGGRGVHRPIRFHGSGAVPAGREELSVLPAEPYWSSRFFRDNEEVRSPNYPDLKGMERIRLAMSWRSLMRSLDRIVYLDWDFVSSHRDELLEEYARQNSGLPEALGLNPNQIPGKYFEATRGAPTNPHDQPGQLPTHGSE